MRRVELTMRWGKSGETVAKGDRERSGIRKVTMGSVRKRKKRHILSQKRCHDQRARGEGRRAENRRGYVGALMDREVGSNRRQSGRARRVEEQRPMHIARRDRWHWCERWGRKDSCREDVLSARARHGQTRNEEIMTYPI
jgi:hypothetical protein